LPPRTVALRARWRAGESTPMPDLKADAAHDNTRWQPCLGPTLRRDRSNRNVSVQTLTQELHPGWTITIREHQPIELSDHTQRAAGSLRDGSDDIFADHSAVRLGAWNRRAK